MLAEFLNEIVTNMPVNDPIVCADFGETDLSKPAQFIAGYISELTG